MLTGLLPALRFSHVLFFEILGPANHANMSSLAREHISSLAREVMCPLAKEDTSSLARRFPLSERTLASSLHRGALLPRTL